MAIAFAVVGVILSISLFFVFKRYYPFWTKGNRFNYWPVFDKAGFDPELEGRYVFSFGSSINCGMGSLYHSYTNYLEKETGIHIRRASMNGSTLAMTDRLSYVPRFNRLRNVGHPDLILIQIAANDASHKVEPGRISNSFNADDFDIRTTAGGIEYLIAKSIERYDCPVALYTLPRYDNPMYHSLVNMTKRICAKWNIELIDMWGDKAFNNISERQRRLFYSDSVHPSMAGYKLWWTPYLKRELKRIFRKIDSQKEKKPYEEMNA